MTLTHVSTEQDLENLSRQGERFYQERQYAEACRCYRELIARRPTADYAYNNLAAALKALNRLDDAIACYQQALVHHPDHPVFLFNLANALQQQGQAEPAITCLQQALQAKPDWDAALLNLGRLLEEQGNLSQARKCYDRILATNPANALAQNNIGNLYKEQRCLEQALACYDRALAADPAYVEAYTNRGLALKDLGRYDEALAAYRRAFALNPDHTQTCWNLSLSLLLRGDWQEGFALYEHRLDHLPEPRQQYAGRPRWQGEIFSGRRLLVCDEQGHGDTLQFSRYLPPVKQRGGIVVFAVNPALIPLFQGLPGVDHLVENDPATLAGVVNSVDFAVPLLSLPYLFGTSPATIPPVAPPPWPDIKQTAPLPPPDYELPLRVGLVWAGNPLHKNDHNRSCRLADLAPLAAGSAIEFHSLQKGDAARQARTPPPGMNLQDHSSELNHFAATAAYLRQLDLIISVDTAVAHLAATLGKPVWLLLPHVPEWRWQLDRTDSPWYPDMRLFRQRRPGDWAELLHRVARELQNQVTDCKKEKVR